MKKITGAALLFFAASAWGGTYVAAKFILGSIPPFSLMLGRYVLALLVMGALCLIKGEKKIDRRDLKDVALASFVGYFLSIALQFWGTDLCGASAASLINVSQTIFLIFLAAPLLGEKITLRKLLAGLVGLAGVALVIGDGGGGGESKLGGGLIVLGSAVTWALFSIMIKKLSGRRSPLIISTYAIFFALLYTLPFSGWEMIRAGSFFFNNTATALCVIYIGVVATGFAFLAWNQGLSMMDASVGGLFIYFQPLTASLLGATLLGEHLSASFFLGGALLLLSVVVALLSPLGLNRQAGKADCRS